MYNVISYQIIDSIADFITRLLAATLKQGVECQFFPLSCVFDEGIDRLHFIDRWDWCFLHQRNILYGVARTFEGMHDGASIFVEHGDTRNGDGGQNEENCGGMLNEFTVRRITPRNVEIDTGKRHPKDADPSDAKEKTLD